MENKEENREGARAFERANNRLVVMRILVTLLLVCAYLFLGASQTLAEGLQSRFSAWWLVNAVYLVVTVLGYSAFMFPLSYYTDYELERMFGKTRQTFGEWLGGYLHALVFELLLASVFFGFIYALLRWAPGYWWLYASLVYVFFNLLLTAVMPLLSPLANPHELIEDSTLFARIMACSRLGGLRISGIYRWEFDDDELAGNAVLAGVGPTRRVILPGDLSDRYTEDELVTIVAHEIAHHANNDLYRHMALGFVMSLVGFYLTDACMRQVMPLLGLREISDIGGFPLFVLVLFLFSILILPIIHGYSRKREMAADAWAVRATGDAGPMITALEKIAEDNLAECDPPRWAEIILHSHPSVKRRIAQANEMKQELDHVHKTD
ncbi:MAG: hypothetical protein EOM20_03540 [Spartobacteria bacterium]|nr:hypothetical protein [Spartobacteria bacterium]